MTAEERFKARYADAVAHVCLLEEQLEVTKQALEAALSNIKRLQKPPPKKRVSTKKR